MDLMDTHFTDYGLETLRVSDEEDEDDLRLKEQKLQVYIAPELKDLNPRIATGPGDVYSYSIILVEIATRADPYGVNIYPFLVEINLLNVKTNRIGDCCCPIAQPEIAHRKE